METTPVSNSFSRFRFVPVFVCCVPLTRFEAQEAGRGSLWQAVGGGELLKKFNFKTWNKLKCLPYS